MKRDARGCAYLHSACQGVDDEVSDGCREAENVGGRGHHRSVGRTRAGEGCT